ncbi:MULTISPECIES: ABC transporter ATP-binding protein [unclassified Chelatococcus]|uniref:ABC transporter ATP-binding protein n=1 Tax=unclassified Chelatococcus TaxID=2638111 RepID=UPI001BCEE341|nr:MULTISPECIES: ABC transporter ATP-binding protein [unclassified Chelatococcus]MBS7701030.1 ABC transporter ATP-binding protein [Chelatococcus sp. YT9]MBX3555563.1 ABC transporter ATP-binding protein [Chelatococcus sp.]
MAKVLEVRDADVAFDVGRGIKKQALSNISLAVGGERPTITAVVGESGSGKTTLIRLLLGFQQPTRGAVLYDGKPVAKGDQALLAVFRREVQAIFQDPFDVFNPFYRIDHPLLTPLKLFGLAKSRDEAYAKIEKTLTSVGLKPSETLGKYPHQLSGGQRQRVMIARALLLDPAIILADEPVSMVDASLRSTILAILYEMNRDLGISLIYVTHDLTTAYQVADSIVVLHGGHVMEVGRAEDVIHRPQHPYTRALIEAVPSPDPDKPWNLDDQTASPERYLPADGVVGLYQIEPLRAIAAPLRAGEATTTAAAIQLAISADLDRAPPLEVPA